VAHNLLLEFKLRAGGLLCVPPDAIRSASFHPGHADETYIRIGSSANGEKTFIVDHSYREVVDLWLASLNGRLLTVASVHIGGPDQ
jgi:hypothetical protein